jgi:hypothetical protein
MDKEEVKKIIREELEDFFGVNKYIFSKQIQILDLRNIQTGRTNGTKIATESDQKIGFYGTTPVDQPEAISDPTGGSTVDTESRSAIQSLIDRLQELGLIK